MIVYLDTSALAKRYLSERSSAETTALIDGAELLGTSILTRVELASALARAVRDGLIGREAAAGVRQALVEDWDMLVRLGVAEAVVARAEQLVVVYQLRGYDAVHLASAMTWQELIDEPVTFASFDVDLARAAGAAGFEVWPKLPA